MAAKWNTGNNIGLLVGATDIEALTVVRRTVPGMWILAPGVGFQGGNLEEARAPTPARDAAARLASAVLPLPLSSPRAEPHYCSKAARAASCSGCAALAPSRSEKR